jgi:hypothetical protein
MHSLVLAALMLLAHASTWDVRKAEQVVEQQQEGQIVRELENGATVNNQSERKVHVFTYSDTLGGPLCRYNQTLHNLGVKLHVVGAEFDSLVEVGSYSALIESDPYIY